MHIHPTQSIRDACWVRLLLCF
jgi:hypothetical protein